MTLASSTTEEMTKMTREEVVVKGPAATGVGRSSAGGNWVCVLRRMVGEGGRAAELPRGETGEGGASEKRTRRGEIGSGEEEDGSLEEEG